MASPAIDPQVLLAVSAVSDVTNYSAHKAALQALDSSICQSNESYSYFILNFIRIASSHSHSPDPRAQQSAVTSLYLFKNKLSRPPLIVSTSKHAELVKESHEEIKANLIGLLTSQNSLISNGASTSISTLVSGEREFEGIQGNSREFEGMQSCCRAAAEPLYYNWHL